MGKDELIKSELYINREISWLKFEERVLEEANDRTNPLLERLKFMSITASNLDEFFMIRVASLRELENSGINEPDIAGMTPGEQLVKVSEATHEFVKKQYGIFENSLLTELELKGIRLVKKHEYLTSSEAEYADRYFEEKVFPVLTPITVEGTRSLNFVRNKALNVLVLLKRKGKDTAPVLSVIEVPAALDRVVRIPGGSNGPVYILLEEIIKRNISSIYLDCDILSVNVFRVLRNADLSIVEDSVSDLIHEVEKQLEKRQWGVPIRLEADGGISDKVLRRISEELGLSEQDIYRIDGPLNLTFLMNLYGLPGFDDLRIRKHCPLISPDIDSDRPVFESIREHDIILLHPYESFSPVIDFINQAADDPEVLAIKQTLYRVGGESPIVRALARAAENGKQVTVLVELKARFDEENNIAWARMLEHSGCHVIYGLPGLKTHCKLLLVVRNEKGSIRRYLHLSTGNYNDTTVKSYTDIGFFTSKPELCEDANSVFNYLSGLTLPSKWNKLSVSPMHLRSRFLELIGREHDNALEGKKAVIVAKLNSLCDKEIIDALYAASSAGVRIELIVRGICCIRSGIPGISDNITVHSVVGLFLEHSRIYYFENGGSPEYYCASADWMPRNLDRRVEVLFPIEDERLRQRLNHLLNSMLKDNVKSRLQDTKGVFGIPSKNSDVEDYCYQTDMCTSVRETEDRLNC